MAQPFPEQLLRCCISVIFLNIAASSFLCQRIQNNVYIGWIFSSLFHPFFFFKFRMLKFCTFKLVWRILPKRISSEEKITTIMVTLTHREREKEYTFIWNKVKHSMCSLVDFKLYSAIYPIARFKRQSLYSFNSHQSVKSLILQFIIRQLF